MLFDYMTLQLIWWAIIVLVLILYATTWRGKARLSKADLEKNDPTF